LPINDAQLFSPSMDVINSENIAIEGYIEHWGKLRDPFYTSGKLLKYDEGDNALYFSQDFKNVIVVYHGILVDEEDGLPLINDKEMKKWPNNE
jgi:GH43 family beta-xylosidase